MNITDAELDEAIAGLETASRDMADAVLGEDLRARRGLEKILCAFRTERMRRARDRGAFQKGGDQVVMFPVKEKTTCR